MVTKRRRRWLRRLRLLAIAVPAALIFNLVLFGGIAPRVKSARAERTAASFLWLVKIDPAEVSRLPGPRPALLTQDHGAWQIQLPPGSAAVFNPQKFAQLTGPERARILETWRERMPQPLDPEFVSAPVWSGFSYLGKGTFCAKRRCAITATRIGDMLYFDITAI